MDREGPGLVSEHPDFAAREFPSRAEMGADLRHELRQATTEVHAHGHARSRDGAYHAAHHVGHVAPQARRSKSSWLRTQTHAVQKGVDVTPRGSGTPLESGNPLGDGNPAHARHGLWGQRRQDIRREGHGKPRDLGDRRRDLEELHGRAAGQDEALGPLPLSGKRHTALVASRRTARPDFVEASDTFQVLRPHGAACRIQETRRVAGCGLGLHLGWAYVAVGTPRQGRARQKQRGERGRLLGAGHVRVLNCRWCCWRSPGRCCPGRRWRWARDAPGRNAPGPPRPP